MRLIEPIDIVDTGSFSRPDPGTYWDRNGILHTAAPNVPRFTYDPLTGEFQQLLVESSSANFTTQSDDLSSSDWSKSSATITANAAVAPDGTMSMDLLVGAAATTNHYAYNTIGMASLSDNVYCSVSAYVKKADFGRVMLAFITKNGSGPNLEFRFADKRICASSQGTSQSGITFDYEECPGGVYRLKIKGINLLTGGTVPRPLIYLADDIGLPSGIWGKTGSPTVTQGAIASPVAGWTGDSIVEAASTSQFYGSVTLNLRAGLEAKAEAYFKALGTGATRYAAFYIPAAPALGNVAQWGILDLATGNVTATSGTLVTYSVTAVTGGWWKLTGTINPVVTGTIAWRIEVSNSNSNPNPSYLGDGVSGFYVAAPYAYETVLDKGFGVFTGFTTASVTGDGVKGTYVWRVMTEPGMNVTSSIGTTTGPVYRGADVIGMMVSNVAENDYSIYDATVTYALKQRCMVITGGYHNIYQSVIAGNLGNDPTTEQDPRNNPVKWQLVSATNVWKPFDLYSSSQASRVDELLYSIQVPASTLIDSIWLGNISAYQARVVVTDPVVGIIFDETFSLIQDVPDFWEFWFAPVVRIKNLAITGIDVYAGVRVDIQLIDIGATVLCGSIVVGISSDYGESNYGLQISSTDYSVKTVDDFGNITLTERPYSDEMTVTVDVPNANVPVIKDQLNSYRARPIVYIGGEDVFDEATSVLGWPDQWDAVFSNAVFTTLSANIKGLT